MKKGRRRIHKTKKKMFLGRSRRVKLLFFPSRGSVGLLVYSNLVAFLGPRQEGRRSTRLRCQAPGAESFAVVTGESVTTPEEGTGGEVSPKTPKMGSLWGGERAEGDE